MCKSFSHTFDNASVIDFDTSYSGSSGLSFLYNGVTKASLSLSEEKLFLSFSLKLKESCGYVSLQPFFVPMLDCQRVPNAF